MRKSTPFISAALTTFMLVMLFGVVSAYQTVMRTNSQPTAESFAPVVQQPVSGVSDVASPPPPAQIAQFTPEQAAQFAAKVIGRTDLYSVEVTMWNGVQAYLVTFSSGDLVYVSPSGQILAITQLQTFSTSSSRGSGSGGGQPRAGGDDESEYEEHDDD